MIRRWIIRCLCMVPLVLCGLGWVWSESHGAAIEYVYRRRGTHGVKCETSSGRVWLLWGHDDTLRSYPCGLSYGSWRLGPVDDRLRPREMTWLGFGFWHHDDSSYHNRRIAVPYWFLLLLSALLLVLAWRTTRPRPWRGQGFPVELAGEKESGARGKPPPPRTN